MAKTSNYWDKRALRRLTDAEKISDQHITQIKKIYEQAYRDVSKEIQRTYRAYSKNTGLDVEKLKELLTVKETDKVWKTLKRQGLDQYIKDNYKSRISRLEQIQAQIYGKAKLIYPKEELQQTMAYKGVINDSYYKAIYDTQKGLGYDFSFNKIDNNTINLLLNEKWSGLNYSQRIWKNTDYLAEALSYTIGGAMLSGQSIEKTTKQIKERFNVSKYYAERLVRTETNHFNNEADAMAYEQMGVKKYVFVATLDTRTSDICQSHDNKVYNFKDKEVGVNYPPLHPNCRSKTRGYISEEVERTLKRRARNPYTGRTEVIDNISYKDWAKKNGLTTNISPKSDKSADKTTKNLKKVPKNDIINISTSDLPNELQTKKELNNSKILTEYINNSKNTNPKVVKVYKLMGKVTNIPTKISHAMDSSISYRYNRVKGVVNDFKLTIPNLKGVDDIANINTVLHENMHFIDFMSGNNTSKLYSSLNSNGLIDVIKNTDASMSDKVSELFTDFNTKCKELRTNISNTYNPQFNKLNASIKAGDIEYEEYSKKWKEVKKLFNQEVKEAELIERSYNGGGINSLQDIYDALSGGVYRDTGKVTFGHGTKYYRSYDNRVKEIVANYGALSIGRPDLIELLKADKPALVSELDKLMDTIISKYGGV